MKMAVATSVFLAIPHVVGFTTIPTMLSDGSSPHPPFAVDNNKLWHGRSSLLDRSWSRPLSITPTARGDCSLRPLAMTGYPKRGSTSDRGLRGRQSLGAISRPTTSTPIAILRMATSPTQAEMSTAVDASGAAELIAGSSLRFAIVGAGADELGRKIGERHGFAVTSMEELMEGRKGRRTDNVKAKAVSQWLAAQGVPSGGIITGFPTTVGEAESLEKVGSSFGRLVVVHEPEARCSEIADNMLENYGDQVTEMYSREEDVPLLCDLAASLLGLGVPTWSETAPTDDLTVVAGAVMPSKASDTVDFTGGDVACRVGDHSGGITLGEADEDEVRAAESESKVVDTLESSSFEKLSPSERMLDSPSSGTMGASDLVFNAFETKRAPRHVRVEEVKPPGYEAAAKAAKVGAETKRTQKQAIKEKKREANNAQRMNTPFYVAVASRKPKSRHHDPVPNIPSRITERISSAAGSGEGNTSTQLNFGPLVLDSPASDCLLAAGITKPTGIQMEGMGSILDGESVILHAMTGSGKTLAFLLPIMQRWTPWLFSTKGVASHSADSNEAFRVLLALPSRELAVQVAREVVLLAGGITAPVELLVDSGKHHDLGKITAPIIVGSAKMLERVIRKSLPSVREDVLSRVECIVVDEVDRLVDVLPKHAPIREVQKRKRHARPISALLKRVIDARPNVQVIACSATIGRPLRRELAQIVGSASAVDATFGSRLPGQHEEAQSVRRDLRVIRDPFASASEEDLSFQRAVPIPETIRHYCVPLRDGVFFSRLEALKAAVRELQPRQPLIFVPPDERVTAVVGYLRRAGGSVGGRAIALHEAMGFGSGSDDDDGDEAGFQAERVSGLRGKHSSEAILQHDKLTEQFRAGPGRSAASDGRGKGGDTDALLSGGMERLREGETGAVLVTGEGSARGLHFDDVDFVFLMQKPKSPDEYVHLAGRTGRQGKAGNVVTLVSFEEFRKMQSWSTSLKIYFEKMDILAVST